MGTSQAPLRENKINKEQHFMETRNLCKELINKTLVDTIDSKSSL